MVAITVVLAVTVGFVVLDLGDSTSQNARAGVSMEETSNGVQVTANNLGGNTEALEVLVDGAVVNNSDGEPVRLTSAGDSVTVTAADGSTVSVRGTTDTGSSSTVQSVTTNSNTLGDSDESTVTKSNIDKGTDRSSGESSIDRSEYPTDLELILTEMDGDGSSDNAYMITNVHELQAMNGDLDGNYVLGDNIDASGTSNWDTDNDETPEGFNSIGDSDVKFTGSLDGNGYEIRGLTINRGNGDYIGLIGMLGDGSERGIENSGSVQNIGLINATITGNGNVGGLVGYIDRGNITESYATGSGTVTGNSDSVGGLIGENGGTNTTIENSYSNITVEGSNEVGGLVGYMSGTTGVYDSYSTGTVEGSNEVGGLVGYNDGAIVESSYAAGSVTASSGDSVGGLIGINHNDDSGVIGSYWDETDSGTGQGSSAVLPDKNGLTTSEMQGSTPEDSTMTNFDWTDTWTTVTNEYPELQWQQSNSE